MSQDQLIMATVVFTLLAIISAYAAVVLEGWSKWVGLAFTFIASFTLAGLWLPSLSPFGYLSVSVFAPLMMFYVWSIIVALLKGRKRKSVARQ